MRNKFRNIVVNSEPYLYRILRDDTSVVQEYTIVQVFKKGRKNTPLLITFDIAFKQATNNTQNNYRILQYNPLVGGLGLLNIRTGETNVMNIYNPSFVARYIKYAIAKGWDTMSKMAISGDEILFECGYKISFLHCYAWNDENKIVILRNYK